MTRTLHIAFGTFAQALLLGCASRLTLGAMEALPPVIVSLEVGVELIDQRCDTEPQLVTTAIVRNIGDRPVEGCLACFYSYQIEGCSKLEDGFIVCSHGPCRAQFRLVPGAEQRVPLYPMDPESCDLSQLRVRAEVRVLNGRNTKNWPVVTDWARPSGGTCINGPSHYTLQQTGGGPTTPVHRAGGSNRLCAPVALLVPWQCGKTDDAR